MKDWQIWKFPLEWDYGREAEVEMPKGAEILTLQVQHGIPCLWARLCPAREKVKRRFSVIGTGWDFDGAGAYVGTYQQDGFVWHVFEIT